MIPLSQRYRLILSDAKNLSNHITPESIDWIITDPPYPYEFISTFSDLSLLASKVLKPDGGLITMSGQSYIPEVLERLGEHLEYHWTCAFLTPGGQAAYNFPRKVNPFWKPLFLYKRKNGVWNKSFGDVIKTQVNNNDKKHHFWGQNVEGFDELVTRFTTKGQTILDPFLGGGTTGLAALQTSRLFIGGDCEQSAIDISEKRIQKLIKIVEKEECLFGTQIV